MGSNSLPDIAIEEFLCRKPSWLRKFLKHDYALTRDEQAEMTRSNWPKIFGQARDEYLELLTRCPERLREYRKLEERLGAKSAIWGLPSVPQGAPRKDALAGEAIALKQAGWSYAKIARELNRRHGPDTTKPDAIRSLIRSRKAATPRRKPAQ